MFSDASILGPPFVVFCVLISDPSAIALVAAVPVASDDEDSVAVVGPLTLAVGGAWDASTDARSSSLVPIMSSVIPSLSLSLSWSHESSLIDVPLTMSFWRVGFTPVITLRASFNF
jgi:hypothetical protein